MNVLRVAALVVAMLSCWSGAAAQESSFTCVDFITQTAAQASLEQHPSDPYGLDPDGNGIACEDRQANEAEGITSDVNNAEETGLPRDAISQQNLEQPSAPGGLGNTRSDLDRVYGTVESHECVRLGDYAIASASYADEWVFYLIEDGTTPSPDDRAIIIHRYADAFDSWE